MVKGVSELIDLIDSKFPQACWVGGDTLAAFIEMEEPCDDDGDYLDVALSDLVAEQLGLTPSELDEWTMRAGIRVEAVPPGYTSRMDDRCYDPPSWACDLLGKVDLAPSPKKTTRVGHFYSFEDRSLSSSLLKGCADELARKGARVLVVDLDDSPLDRIFLDVPSSIESSILGAYLGCEVKPVNASSAGVDRLTRHPRSDRLLEAVAFESHLRGTPLRVSKLINSLQPVFDRYDVVLVKHEPGLGTHTLPWMHTLPGGLCLYDDGVAPVDIIKPVSNLLWRLTKPPHGIVVTPWDLKSEAVCDVPPAREMLHLLTREEVSKVADPNTLLYLRTRHQEVSKNILWWLGLDTVVGKVR